MEIHKDVYETEDRPEVDQDYDDDVKDCVDILNISAGSAFNRFKGKEVNINEKNKCNEWKGHDNPLDRAQRIIHELDALRDSLKNDKNNEKVDSTETVTKEQLLILTEALTIQVRELDLEKFFGTASGFEIKDPKHAVYKQLLKKLDHFNVQLPKPKRDEAKHSYSLIRRTSVNEYLNKMKMTNLSKRIEVLEKAVGDNNVKLSAIVSDCPSKGLLEAVEKLTAKTSLLNPNQLVIVESRLNGVANKLQNTSTVASNATPVDAESQAKIAELYELIKKHDPVMDTVANIVSQCVTMQDFHAKGVALGQCLSHLEVKQHEVASKQQISEMVLKNIEENMPKNFATMENNMKLIDERIKKLRQ